MRAKVATFFALAILAVAGSSSPAPPEMRRPEITPPRQTQDPDPHPPACTGHPCNVSAYQGTLPEKFELAKMQRLGCDAPFNHLGGIKEGQTSWVGFSCPAHVRNQFTTLPEHFSDACLPKRHGRVYVPVFEATCGLAPWPYDMPFSEKAKKLGCGPMQKYQSGNGAGFLGGIGSYCPDTPAVHNAAGFGFLAGYCDGCIKVPAGQLFVVWEPQVGPNCPNGCPQGSGPSHI